MGGRLGESEGLERRTVVGSVSLTRILKTATIGLITVKQKGQEKSNKEEGREDQGKLKDPLPRAS